MLGEEHQEHQEEGLRRPLKSARSGDEGGTLESIFNTVGWTEIMIPHFMLKLHLTWAPTRHASS